MTTRKRLRSLLVCAVAVAYGCGRSTNTTELQRVQAGPLEVLLLSSRDAIRRGRDVFTIEFRSRSDGKLVDVGAVRGSASMPMPGASPMFGTIDVTKTDTPGRYTVASQLDMAGTWRTTLEWDGPAGKGSVTFPGLVR